MKITTISHTLIGSGEGFGALIDADVIFDEVGFPYIPGKRVKGLLRQSAEEIIEMMKLSKLAIKNIDNADALFNNLFGKSGQEKSSDLYISNFYLKGYNELAEQIKILIDKNAQTISVQDILENYTSIRTQTKIDESSGTAEENSLRTSRVLNKNLEFFGELEFYSNSTGIKELLVLSTENLRRMGTMRSRGFGEVQCTIIDNSKVVNVNEILGAK
jgi:CRISPR-associated protein Csx10